MANIALRPSIVQPGRPVAARHASVRKWLVYFTLEGVFGNTFIILTSGAFLTGLALLMGADDFQIGLLGAIPFLAQAAQLAAAYFVDRTGQRKKTVTSMLMISRQVWWLAIPLLFVAMPWKMAVLIAIISISSLTAMAAMPAWIAWVVDVVPGKIRARYLGNRYGAVAASTIAATIGGGLILDHFREIGRPATGFAVIISIACLFGIVSVFFVNSISDRPPETLRVKTRLSRLKDPLKAGHFRHLLSVFFVWNLGIGVSAAFFAPHMLNNLRMDFTGISIYAGLFALAAIIFNRSWGKVIDRCGSKPVAVFCAFGISVIPLLWLVPRPETAWLLMIEAVYSGLLWAGFTLAAFTMPIANSPQEHRTSYLAMFSVVTGLGFFLASLAGGILASKLGGLAWHWGQQTIVNYHLLFCISSMIRLLGACLMTAFHEPREKTIPVMISFIGYAALKRLSVGRQILPFGIRPHTDQVTPDEKGNQ